MLLDHPWDTQVFALDFVKLQHSSLDGVTNRSICLLNETLDMVRDLWKIEISDAMSIATRTIALE